MEQKCILLVSTPSPRVSVRDNLPYVLKGAYVGECSISIFFICSNCQLLSIYSLACLFSLFFWNSLFLFWRFRPNAFVWAWLAFVLHASNVRLYGVTLVLHQQIIAPKMDTLAPKWSVCNLCTFQSVAHLMPIMLLICALLIRRNILVMRNRS